MKHLLFLMIFLACLNSSVTVAQAARQEGQAFERVIKSSGVPLKDLGIYVVKGETILFENKSKTKFVPASLSKIITAIATLKVFKPDLRLSTELRASAPIQGGVLTGPLYIKGNGDPSFISEQMWVLVNNFVRSKIKKIEGPITVDSSVFDDKHFDSSRQNVRVDRAYDSPVSGLSFNWNTVNVYIRPGSKVGEPLDIQVDPENDYFTVINKTTTLAGNKAAAIVVDKQPDKDGEKIIVSGSMGIRQSEAVKYASVTHPDLWVGKNLIQFLKQRGIEVVNSKVVSGRAPEKSDLLAESKGWTIFEAVDGMMKFSNNFLAEMLTKNISTNKGAKQGSIEGGVALIKEIIETNYGIKKSEYDFFSPSGFSSKNKISAYDLGTLMSRAYNDFTISSHLVSSMAYPQYEGTLSKRMMSLKEPMLVRAKTGLLSGVTGLAGYASTSKGEVVTFVFMYNGSGKEAQARDLFDKLAMQITQL